LVGGDSVCGRISSESAAKQVKHGVPPLGHLLRNARAAFWVSCLQIIRS